MSRSRTPETVIMRPEPGRQGTFTAVPPTHRLDTLACWMDSRFSILGVRFGIDPILGIIPGVGDLAGMVLSAYLVGEGYRLGARKRTLALMSVNAAAETLVGSIPVAGTVVAVFWKANRANMEILKRDLERSRPVRRL